MLGLLEILADNGGEMDLFAVDAMTEWDFGRTIAVVKAAELLDLVDTPKRQVILSPEGARLVKASPADRKALWREHVLRLRLFRDVEAALAVQPEHRVDRDFVLELIAVNMPNEDYEAMFDTFVGWARFADLFSYDEASEAVAPQH
jgi:NitT/TauT family transport system ATP-binding protein